MKYKDFLRRYGLTNNEVISVLQPHFPKFTKIQCSMLSHPDDYGVRLDAKAERILKNHASGKGVQPKPSTQGKVKRTKSHRLSVRLDGQCYDMVRNKMREKGSESVQSYLENLIKETANAD